jgi:hypothetical protein
VLRSGFDVDLEWSFKQTTLKAFFYYGFGRGVTNTGPVVKTQ